MAEGRFGDLDHPDGGGRFGGLGFSTLQASLSAAYPLDFAVEQASVRFTSDRADESAYVVVTDSPTPPSAEQIELGQDGDGQEATAWDSLTSAEGENEFSDLSIPSGYWYAHIVQVGQEGHSNIVSTVKFRVAGDSDGPDEWFWPEITTPAGDGVWPEGAEAGMPGWITRVSGGPITVLSNGSTMSESDEWATEAQVWDWSLNDGLGGLSEVYAVSFAPPVQSDAIVTGVASELALEASAGTAVGQRQAVIVGAASEVAVVAAPGQALGEGFGAAVGDDSVISIESALGVAVATRNARAIGADSAMTLEAGPGALTVGVAQTGSDAVIQIVSTPGGEPALLHNRYTLRHNNPNLKHNNPDLKHKRLLRHTG